MLKRLGDYLRHEDPLVEAGNDVALLVGLHLPFWPLYLIWCAGLKTLPWSLLTMTAAPAFCVVPWLSRRHALAGRVLLVLVGIANTVLTTWVVGADTGTELFLLPCVALAAMLFRRRERIWMVGLGLLPIAVWYGLRGGALTPLQHFVGADLSSIQALNVVSVAVLITAYGWILGTIYARMEGK